MQMLMHSFICSPESFRGDAGPFLFIVNLLPAGITYPGSSYANRTSESHRNLVRAVSSPRYAHPIRIGSPPTAVDVIGIETTLVRHGGDQRAVAGRALCKHARAA